MERFSHYGYWREACPLVQEQILSLACIPGYSLHTELEMLVSGGMTPQQALFAATVTPARFHDLQDDVGQIKPGMRADLLLLQNNPLTDIRHTRGIEAVMLAGQWVR